MDDKIFRVSDIARSQKNSEINRRTLLKRAAVTGVAFSSLGSLMAACEDADDVATDDLDDGTELDDDPAVDTDDDPDTPDDEPDPTDDDAGEVSEGGDVHVMYSGVNNGLSPMFGSTGNTQQIVSMMFGTVVKMDDASEPIPDLAESIEINDDATEYTFELHDNVYFNDGEHLTSSDIRFTYETVIDPNTGSYWGPRLMNIAGADAYAGHEADSVEGIETPDDYTVILRMEEPHAVFLLSMTQFTGLGIAPEHVLADIPRDELEEHEFNWAPSVSAGPFQFHEHVEGRYLELHRNENYFRGAPAVERLFIRELEHVVGIAQLESGELDLTDVPIDEAERVEGMEQVRLESAPSVSILRLPVNFRNERFQDVRVRQALMYALDRPAMVDAILHGRGIAYYSTIVGPDGEWLGEPEGLNPYEYDPETALSLLEEADWDFDEPIEFILQIGQDPYRETVATTVQAQWADVGVQLEVNIVEAGTAAERVEAGDWDVRLVAGGVWAADPHIASEYYHSRYKEPIGNNYGHYENERVDELFDLGRATLDEEERREIYTEIAQILNDEVPWIDIFSDDKLFGVSERLQGFEPPRYFNNKFWNAHEWSVNE